MSFLVFQDFNDEVFVLAESKVVAIKVNPEGMDSVFASGNIEFQGRMAFQCDTFVESMKAAKLLAVPTGGKQ